jgi:hypothetical protein
MKHSTRLYLLALIMAVIQFDDMQSLTFGFWALLCIVFARMCEGAEAEEEQQRK